MQANMPGFIIIDYLFSRSRNFTTHRRLKELSCNVLFILKQVCSTMLVCGVMRNFFPHHIDNDDNSLSPCVTSQNCLTTPLLVSDQHQISPCNFNA